ncbi:hypothetical protein T05_2108 [Trichinella murrelli]|uniref:Uncharacterized protein n=1 Tax=Trichinella murrelli TaxID=144512 RepID=A0A0V0TLE2_9BILA|nr:hypothetical protein T05_2108 [Trichinella murrelli]
MVYSKSKVVQLCRLRSKAKLKAANECDKSQLSLLSTAHLIIFLLSKANSKCYIQKMSSIKQGIKI